MDSKILVAKGAGYIGSQTGLIGYAHGPESHFIPRLLDVAAIVVEKVKMFDDDYPAPGGSCIRGDVYAGDFAGFHVQGIEHLAASVSRGVCNPPQRIQLQQGYTDVV